jgi:hypothetical protein
MTRAVAPHALGAPARLFLAAAVGVGLLVGIAASASATTVPAAQNAVGASTSATAPLVGLSTDVSPAMGRDSCAPQTVSASATGVAADSAAGLPRNALGQFTSGAGGDSAAAAAGRSAHASYPNTLGWSGDDVWFNRTIPGTNLRPDAINWTRGIVGELKPANPSTISAGWRQVNGYKDLLEAYDGRTWTAQVDVYTP